MMMTTHDIEQCKAAVRALESIRGGLMPLMDRNDHACLVEADSAIEQAVDEIQCLIEEQNGEDIFAEEER